MTRLFTVRPVLDQHPGTFNSGRLATMFCVVYKFCIKYIQCHGIAKILPLIKHLVPEVVTFLVKIGFLKWVTDTGGWVSDNYDNSSVYCFCAFRYVCILFLLHRLLSNN